MRRQTDLSSSTERKYKKYPLFAFLIACSILLAGSAQDKEAEQSSLFMMPGDHSTGSSAKLMDYIGKQVEATGVLHSKGGVNGIMTTGVEPSAEEKSAR